MARVGGVRQERRLLERCPACGSDRIASCPDRRFREPVASAVFHCGNCGRCWSVAHARVSRLDPLACPVCTDRERCNSLLPADDPYRYPRVEAGRSAPPPAHAPGSLPSPGNAATVSADLRFVQPLYSVGEAARILAVPVSTFRRWTSETGHSQRGDPVSPRPVVTTIGRGPLTVPFVGLAEGLVLAAMRRIGVPMPRVRAAIETLESGIGLEHALASRRLYTDGAELLYDVGRDRARSGGHAIDLLVVRSGQRMFSEPVLEYLRRIEYAPDGYARLIHVPGYRIADVVCDSSREEGKPIVAANGARVSDLLARFWAGISLDALAEQFRVPVRAVEDVIRVGSVRAA